MNFDWNWSYKMRHFSKKTASILAWTDPKNFKGSLFLTCKRFVCKNFVGKVQSKMGHAQKEPRKQICQQQTGNPRTLKPISWLSIYCFLRLFSAKIALDFQSVMDEIFPHWCFIEQKWNTGGRHIIFSFCYTMYFFLSISLLVLFTSSHFIYVCQKMKVFHEKKNWTENVLT